jgi:uncharacterized repeat protein (TIGR03803 family)
MNPLNRLLLAILMLVATVRAAAQTFTVLHAFTQDHNNPASGYLTNSDGLNPNAGLVISTNTLFGAAQGGGTNGTGTIFSLRTDGLDFMVLHMFSVTALNSTNMDIALSTNEDGAFPCPEASLALSGTKLYGTARGGGTNGYGTVFSLNTDGTEFNVLHAFNNDDGRSPVGGVVLSGDTLYGITTIGTSNFNGTIYSLKTNGSHFTVLHTFSASPSPYTNWDGSRSQAGLILFNNTLYGTAFNGGANDQGTIFSIKTDGNAFTVLHSFSRSFYNPTLFTDTNYDGAHPNASVGLAGNTLYGTAIQGGLFGDGTLFSLDTAGSNFNVLHNFQSGSSGWFPASGVVLSGDTLYGGTTRGGSSAYGAIYSITRTGLGYTLLHSFSGPDGKAPDPNLLLSGNTIYGATVAGGSYDNGVIYSLTIPIPPLVITSFNLASPNIIINAANGLAGETYDVLTSPDLTLPLPQWSAIASTNLIANGDFSILATNPVPAATQRFYILQKQ